MPELPLDPVELEQTLAGAIRDVFLSVPLIAQYAQVHTRERFPDSDEDDVALSTVADPSNPDLNFTSIIQIGMPTVNEVAYTSENQTQLNFSYPITFDMEVKDQWDNSDATLVYTNSRALFMAIYMLARRAFKADGKTLGGFQNCEHDYLQQESVATVDDEETGTRFHSADWSLDIHVKGILT